MRKIPSVQTSIAPKTAPQTAPKMPPKIAPKASPAAPALAAAPQPVRRTAKTAPIQVAAPAKAMAAKTVKKVPIQAVPTRPAPVRVIAETPATYFAGVVGRAWRMSGKHSVAYVQSAAVAGELLATEPRHLAKSAMAVYYDRKGRPFAWQLRFDSARWDEVIGKLA